MFNIYVNFFMNNLYFIIAFIFFFIADFVLGFSNAYKNNEISSKKMKLGGFKFAGYMLIILGCIMFDVMLYTGSELEIFSNISPIAKISIAMICFNEFISNLENADKLGITIPAPLKKLIALKETLTEGKDE